MRISIAALALMGVMMTGCSSEDNIQQTEKTSNQRTLTFNVGISDEDAGTRAVTADGTATFAVGDQMAVIYTTNTGNYAKAVSEPLTAGDLSFNNQMATFTVTVNDPDYRYDVRYIYPASMVNDDCNINWAALDNQDGTLGALSRNLDYCEGIGQWNYDGAQYQLPYLSLANQLSILALTLKNSEGTEDITNTITSLTLREGDNTYKVKRDASPGPIYMAIRPTTSATIEVTANSSSAYYSKSLQYKTYDSGHLFNLPWRMSVSNNIDLSKVYSDYEAKDGDILTGTLGENVKISIADGATITLNGVTINGTDDSSYSWAGLTCEGDATITLADGTTNIVKGFNSGYSGIYVPSGNTLIINGTGSLNASSNVTGAGIGGGSGIPCGNIEIQGGVITAKGGDRSAGIGSCETSSCGTITISGGTVTANGGDLAAGIGSSIGEGSYFSTYSSCGNITISGGTVNATGGNFAAGIGSGCGGQCSDITIAKAVTYVKATRGTDETNTYEPNAVNSKHVGPGDGGTCGTVTIGDKVYWNNNAYQGDGKLYLHDNSWLEYPF